MDTCLALGSTLLRCHDGLRRSGIAMDGYAALKFGVLRGATGLLLARA